MKTKPHTEILNFGSKVIHYNLHRIDRKRLRIVVSPDLSVDVFAPLSSDDERIRAVLKKKAGWIAKKLDKQESYHPLPVPKQYISGETIVYLGRHYRLKIQKGNNNTPKLLGRYLWIWTIDKKDFQKIKKEVQFWYRKRAHDIFRCYLDKCYVVASRHGVPEPQLTIRDMRRRWGSCSQAGRITLNLKLVQTPVHCIEYVIMHELCHMKYHNHSKAFFSLQTRCLPDWRRRKEVLDKFRPI